MMEKEEVFEASDGKEYYVMDSIMYNNLNYVMIGEINAADDTIVGMGKIMLNNTDKGTIEKVTDPELLVKIAVEFGNGSGAFDF
jgi:hypothetical protein